MKTVRIVFGLALSLCLYEGSLSAMEADLIVEDFTEVYGEDVAKSLTKEEMIEAEETFRSKMEIEGDQKAYEKLPENFKKEYRAQFRKYLKEGYTYSEGKLLPKEDYDFSQIKESFLDNIKKNGFSNMEAEAVRNFKIKGFNPDNFPVITPADIASIRVNEQYNFQVAEPEGVEKTFQEAEQKVFNAQRNVEYANQVGDKDLITRARDDLSSAQKELNTRVKSIEDAYQNTIKKGDKDLQANLEKQLKGYKARQEAIDNRVELQKTRSNIEEAQKNLAQTERKSALREYEEAKATKQEADKEVADLKKTKPGSKELAKAEEKQRIANEDYKAAKEKYLASGEAPFGMKAWQRFKQVRNFIGQQMAFGLVGGFAFSVPNFVIGPIEQSMTDSSARKTLLTPQRFGKIWMQIPRDFISSGGEPLVVKNIYVGIGADPKEESVEHSDNADADSYFALNPPYFMARNEYDDYAQSAITDPTFPGYLVHAQTGFHFIEDGNGSYEYPIVPLFGQVPKDFRGRPLQNHLNKQAGDILNPVTTYEYYEFRRQKADYNGNKVIGRQLDATSQESQNFVKERFPDLAREDEFYSKALAGTVNALMAGTNFGQFKLSAFEALDDATIKKLGGQKAVAESKPYVALSNENQIGTFIYKTADTPTIKSIRAQMQNDPDLAESADKIFEYVFLLYDQGRQFARLQMPEGSGKYNYPSYALNPKVEKMISLFDGTQYTKDGTSSPTKLSVEQILGNVNAPQGIRDQILLVNQFITDKSKYGPFIVGDKTLQIEKAWVDAGVPVYRAQGFLENGADDYFVATQGSTVISLPGSPTNFVSLVTSRIYDKELIPYNKENGGRPDSTYAVYKIGDQPPVVIPGPVSLQQGVEKITDDLKAPMYTLFMDSDINPNTIAQDQIPKKEDAQWLAQKVGRFNAVTQSIQWPLPTPSPDQWVLSERGPKFPAEKGAQAVRIADVLQQKEPQLFKTINAAYNKWKTYYKSIKPETIQNELGPFPWEKSEAGEIINIRATSATDLKNGNYVYTSPFYPNEYLVMSGNQDGTQDFAKAYDPASPQKYAISITSGNVYSQESPGEAVKRIANVDQLIKRVTDVQGKFLPDLQKNIEQAKRAQTTSLQKQQYGPDTEFGPFKLFLFKDDLERGQYIYADVTNIKDPLSINEKQLMDQVNDFYIAIKGDIGSGDEEYAVKVPQADFVVSLVSGAVYSRGGQYHGGFPGFVETKGATVDPLKGYFDQIVGILKTKWQAEQNQYTEIRPALLKKLQALNKGYYDTILKEREEIAKAKLAEDKLFQPLDANTIKNLNTQPYIQWLQDALVPPRYIKLYDGKYYSVSPEEPVVIIDYNVGDKGKDNKVGMSYDAQGKALVRMTDWVLDNARAYAGIAVSSDGKQDLSVALTHPKIPMKGMVELNVSALQTSMNKARSAVAKADAQVTKNPQDDAAKKVYRDAAQELATAKMLYQSAQAIQNIGLDSKIFSFYYNKEIGSYFVKVTSKGSVRYIDLIGGYEYDSGGDPLLIKTPVYKSGDGKYSLIVAQDDVGLMRLQLLQPDGTVSNWVNYSQEEDAQRGSAYMKYSFVDNDANELVAYYDKDADTYKVSWQKGEDVEFKDLGTFSPDSKQFFSLVSYFGTGKTDKMTYNATDAKRLSSVYFVWDGGEDLKLQSISYNNQLLPLNATGKGAYSASYKDATGSTNITVVLTTKVYGSVESKYLSITDKGTTYNFHLDFSLLDPTLPVSCDEEVKEDEIDRLNYWKICKWGINAVNDIYGARRLVTSLPDRLPGVSKVDINRVKKQACNDGKTTCSAAGKVADKMQLIFYDATGNRYLYQLSSDQDAYHDNQGKIIGYWSYFVAQWEGWYVDLATGILYRPEVKGYYPVTTMHLPQLYMLLDRLGVSVAPVQVESGGQPVYDDEGNQKVDPTTKKPILVKQGLVYRNAPTVSQEESNQQIHNIAKEFQALYKR